MPKLPISIVIPTLNEAENIDILLMQIFACTADQLDVQMVIVDDGSTDGTREIVRAWEANHPVKLLARDGKCDLATAVIDGAKLAQNDVVVVMDADLSHRPEQIVELAMPVLDGTHDMAIGSRYVPGGRSVGWPWYRQLLSRGATLLSWPLADARDPMSGFFAVRREHLIAVGNDAQGYKIGLEVLARNPKNLRVTEVPIVFTQRQHGQSKLKAATILQYLDRLLVLSGGSLNPQIFKRFGIIASFAMMLDFLLFILFRHAGWQLSASHITSFFIAVIATFPLHLRWTIPDNASPTAKSRLGQWVSFLILSLLALFLRGGVLSSLVDHWHVPQAIAMIPAMLASNLVLLGVLTFMLFPQQAMLSNSRLAWRIGMIGGVAYVLLLKLVYIGSIDLIPNEAYYWNYAQHPAMSYLDHPPMVAWLISAGTFLLGDTEPGVRLGAIVCSVITLVFMYKLTRDLFDKSTAMLAMLLLTVLPFFFIVAGFLMTPDAPLTACWAGTLYFLQRALLQEKHHAWYGAGICLGLGLLSKYTIALLGPAALVLMLIDPQMRRQLRRIEPYLAFGIAMLIFTPVLAWNAQNHWASFVFQGSRRLAESGGFAEHTLLIDIAVLLTPIGLLAAWSALRHRNFETDEFRIKQRFMTVFTLIPLSVFLLFSLRHTPKINWTGPLWLAVIPLISWTLSDHGAIKWPNLKLDLITRKLWQPTLLGTLLVLGGMMHYLAIGIPGIGYQKHMHLPIGWSQLGHLVERIEEQIESHTHQEPLVVGTDKYFTASQVAFYRSQFHHHDEDNEHEANEEKTEGYQQTGSNNLFNDRGLMYRYWFPQQRQIGRIMLLISPSQNNLKDTRLAPYFESLGPVHRNVISKDGQNVGCFYYRVCYHYHAPAHANNTHPLIKSINYHG